MGESYWINRIDFENDRSDSTEFRIRMGISANMASIVAIKRESALHVARSRALAPGVPGV